MSPQNGWVKFWRCALESDDLMAASPAARWTFLACISMARVKGKYRGYLVNDRYRPISQREMATTAGVNRKTLRSAITFLSDPERAMLEWRFIKEKRCLFIVNYDHWQAEPVAQNAQRVVVPNNQHVAQTGQAQMGHVGRGGQQKLPSGTTGPPVGTKDVRTRRRSKGPTPPPPPVGDERDPEGDLGDGDGSTARALEKKEPVRVDTEPTSPRGIPPVFIDRARLQFQQQLVEHLGDAPEWNGGYEQQWVKRIALMIHKKEATWGEIAAWMSDTDLHPRTDEVRVPAMWQQRCYKARDQEKQRQSWTKRGDSDGPSDYTAEDIKTAKPKLGIQATFGKPD